MSPVVLLLLLLVALAGAACGASDDIDVETADESEVPTAPSATSEPDGGEPTSDTAVAQDQPSGQSEAYCLALDDMAAAQPQGSMSGPEFDEAMATYLDAVERLANLSTVEEAEVLREFAQVMAASTAEPSSAELGAQLAELGGDVAEITVPALRECGIDVDTNG